MQELDTILQEATAAIPQEFFLLRVHGSDKTFYRERVYCYELYHRMRLRWPDGCPYFLNGEIDKQGHPDFPDVSPKPDFLVHLVGHDDNDTIIEVKSANADREGIEKDLATLLHFRKYGYKRAIFLIFGLDPDTAHAKVVKCGTPEQRTAIELWVHPNVGHPAFSVKMGV